MQRVNYIFIMIIFFFSGGGIGCIGALAAMLMGLLAVSVGLYMFCRYNTKDKFCIDSSAMLTSNFGIAQKQCQEWFGIVQKQCQEWFDILRVFLLRYYDILIEAVNEIMDSSKTTT